MENAITAGLSKQIVLTRALDVTANNIANQSTAGFKAERLAFREYVARVEGETGDKAVSLVFDPSSYTDFSAGGLESTGTDLDFAIEGEGFFAVETGSGVRYTRDGRFTVNEFGELVTRRGARVLNDGGAPILLDPEAGAILSTPDGELQQGGSAIGRLGVFTVVAPKTLRKDGDNLYAAVGSPDAAENTRILRGFVETSNIAPITAVTDMIAILRAYQQAAQVVQTADELAREAVSRLGDVA